MTYFERSRVSPADRIWDAPRPPVGKKSLPRWQYYTDTMAAPPVGARPFYLSGEAVTTLAPFAGVLVPGCSLAIDSGYVAIVKNLVVWKLRGGTLDPPAARTFWTLAMDGTPIGDGYQAVYTFGIGGVPSGLNGLYNWPVELRLDTAGVLDLSVTVEDPSMAGSNITIGGVMQGWLYPAELDLELDSARD